MEVCVVMNRHVRAGNRQVLLTAELSTQPLFTCVRECVSVVCECVSCVCLCGVCGV